MNIFWIVLILFPIIIIGRTERKLKLLLYSLHETKRKKIEKQLIKLIPKGWIEMTGICTVIGGVFVVANEGYEKLFLLFFILASFYSAYLSSKRYKLAKKILDLCERPAKSPL
jgi:hypothetical protein